MPFPLRIRIMRLALMEPHFQPEDIAVRRYFQKVLLPVLPLKAENIFNHRFQNPCYLVKPRLLPEFADKVRGFHVFKTLHGVFPGAVLELVFEKLSELVEMRLFRCEIRAVDFLPLTRFRCFYIWEMDMRLPRVQARPLVTKTRVWARLVRFFHIWGIFGKF